MSASPKPTDRGRGRNAPCAPAEDTVARLNALFEIVVPAVVDAGGHVNKFLGDGALAVFGAPNDLAQHADAAVSAAVLIHRLVAERFGGELRIGIGINTGVVIAGTIGGAGKLEFTLIGDTVNVAARVEQLTKTTGDPILLTQQSVDALVPRPPGLTDRGSHAIKGKSAAVQVFSLDPGTDRSPVFLALTNYEIGPPPRRAGAARSAIGRRLGRSGSVRFPCAVTYIGT
jgi:class 3 adenylate cyclase